MKKLLIGLAALCCLGIFYLILSPYKYRPERGDWAIVEKVEINAHAGQLYTYLGNSANAAEWSSYVSEIRPLNEQAFPDGAKNSRRRCFYIKDHRRTWDEQIDSTRENAYRRLRVYNLHNFPMSSEHLLTEQQYLSTKYGTKLSLTLYLDRDASLLDQLKIQAAAFIVASIFEGNLQKIKEVNEGRSAGI